MAELPYGRGLRRGDDVHINQGESWASRSREIGLRDEWMISPMRSYGADASATTGFSQYLRLALLPRLEDGFDAKKARLRVTTSSAGSFIRCAIYQFDIKDGEQTLTKVPSSDVLFLGDSTGVKTELLPNIAELRSGERYFMGAYVSNTAVGISAETNQSTRVVPMFTLNTTLASSSVLLPGRIPRATLSTSFSFFTPWILYLSTLAAEVLA